MKKSIIVTLNIGFWICYFLIIGIMLAVFFRSSNHAEEQTGRLLNAFKNLFMFAFLPSFITFYAYYFILFPKYLKIRKMLLTFLFGILFAIGASILCYSLHRYFIVSGLILDMDEGGKKGDSTAYIVIPIMTFISTISGIGALVIKGFITWFEEIKLKEELKQKTHETEMALVKAQLDPHFLFNTLNNIDVLMIDDPEEASIYLNKLSDILRFMLYETKTDKILLKKEIEYISKYIELQRIRTANASYISFQTTGLTENKTIAPMVFIPFIENAFKHSTNKKVNDAIKVHINIKKDTVTFICENKFDSSRKPNLESSGIGNELIVKRLNLIYPEKHKLEVINQTDFYSVHLTIKNG
jgi:two-component system, LytTR family, sensor kinase